MVQNLTSTAMPAAGETVGEAFVDDGVSINSPVIDGLATPDAKKKISSWLAGRAAAWVAWTRASRHFAVARWSST